MALPISMVWVAAEAAEQLNQQRLPKRLPLAWPGEPSLRQLSVPLSPLHAVETLDADGWRHLLGSTMALLATELRAYPWIRFHQLPVDLPGVCAHRVSDRKRRISVRVVEQYILVDDEQRRRIDVGIS